MVKIALVSTNNKRWAKWPWTLFYMVACDLIDILDRFSIKVEIMGEPLRFILEKSMFYRLPISLDRFQIGPYLAFLHAQIVSLDIHWLPLNDKQNQTNPLIDKIKLLRLHIVNINIYLLIVGEHINWLSWSFCGHKNFARKSHQLIIYFGFVNLISTR